MDALEDSVRSRLNAEAQSASTVADLRTRVLSAIDSPAPSRSRLGTGLICGLAATTVAAIVTGGLVLTHRTESSPVADRQSVTSPRDSQRPENSPHSTAGQAKASTIYTAEELAAATERLLAASRAGQVPEISFVRNEPDLSGLVVAVPQETIEEYGLSALRALYIEAGHVDVNAIESVELPKNGLPTLPTES